MRQAGQRVAKAWRMVRSATKAASSTRVRVWCSMPMESRIGRMVRQTIAWPGLNSPSVPRSLTTITTGTWQATARLAIGLECTLGQLLNKCTGDAGQGLADHAKRIESMMSSKKVTLPDYVLDVLRRMGGAGPEAA